MKRLLLLALCSATLFSCSQNEAPSIFCNIYGIVSDASSGEPIRNASVTLSPTNLTTVTGADGHFEFTDLDEGQYKIQCSATGYQTNSRQISVHAGGTATCDIALTPIVTSDAIQITPSSGLNFGTTYNQLEFRIENIGNAGTVSWTIQNQASWISVSPQSGSTEMGKSSSIIVTIDRSKITENSTSFITVETSGGSQSIRVSVEHKSDDNGGSGGNNSGGNDGNNDDDNDTTEAIQISPSSGLNFGTTYNQLEFRIENIGNAGTVSWTIQNQASWISVSPQSGSTEMGKSSSIIVTIDRAQITENSTSFITVETSGGSQSVRVSVEHKSDDNDGSGGNNPGGDAGNDDNNTDTTTEDYSSAKVTSCDSRIIAKIVDCKRSGSSVVFNYTLTNDGMGDIKQWRINPPSSRSGVAPKSNVYDDLDNEYLYPTMVFRNKSFKEFELSVDFPEGPACKGSVTISDFPKNATKLNVILGVAVYNHSTSLAGNKIKFEDIPIY